MQEQLQPTISVLTAMITPAVLISACGTLILSTSQRLSRVIGRVYEWTRWLDAASRSPNEEAFAREHAAAFFLQFEVTSRRARLLHWGLSAFYFALGTFVADMLVIGVIALLGMDHSWPAVGLGLFGAVLLLFGCAALAEESRLGLTTTDREMRLLREMAERHVPADAIGARGGLVRQVRASFSRAIPPVEADGD
ncbi:MAG: DUF2721 domain-containing protein [Thermomicrobiales bacterium]